MMKSYVIAGDVSAVFSWSSSNERTEGEAGDQKTGRRAGYNPAEVAMGFPYRMGEVECYTCFISTHVLDRWRGTYWLTMNRSG